MRNLVLSQLIVTCLTLKGLNATPGNVPDDRVLKTIILGRHCARAPISMPQVIFGWDPTYLQDFEATQPFPVFDTNYTSEMYPTLDDYGGELKTCTAAGLQKTSQFAQFMANVFSGPFHVVSPPTSPPRIKSAIEISSILNATGQTTTFRYANIWDQRRCEQIDPELAKNSLEERLADSPLTDGIECNFDLLRRLLGENGKFDIADVPITTENGIYDGKMIGAGSIAEEFMFERMSNIEAAFGKATDMEILSVSQLFDYAVHMRNTKYIAGREATGLMNDISQVFADEKMRGTTYYSGHAFASGAFISLFDLSYEDPTFGINATPPSSAIAMTLHETSEGERYVSSKMFSVNFAGNITETEGSTVFFAGKPKISLSNFSKILDDNLHADCL